MHLRILLTITLLAAAKCSFSQDTTGGTRPQVIIPLHHKAKPKDESSSSNTGINMPGTTGLPQKIDGTKPKQKKIKKHRATPMINK